MQVNGQGEHVKLHLSQGWTFYYYRTIPLSSCIVFTYLLQDSIYATRQLNAIKEVHGVATYFNLCT